jgi:hypothetical protein
VTIHRGGGEALCTAALGTAPLRRRGNPAHKSKILLKREDLSREREGPSVVARRLLCPLTGEEGRLLALLHCWGLHPSVGEKTLHTHIHNIYRYSFKYLMFPDKILPVPTVYLF